MRMMNGRFRIAAVSLVAATALAACAKSNTSEPAQGGGSSGSSGKISTASVSGIGSVLEDSKGFTLYHLTTESSSNIQCTGSCAQTWPPLIASGGQVPSAAGSIAGKLGTITRPDGSVQVTFDGMPLYTYSGDSGPGQSNGQGISGVWFAVSPSGSTGGAAGGSGSTGGSGSGGSGGGGYGYGS